PYSFSEVNTGGGGVGLTDFGFTDPTDAPQPNGLSKVLITSLPDPASGTLTLNSGGVSVGDEIDANQIHNLVFTPFLDKNSFTGSTTFSFTFQVRDDGGLLNASPPGAQINLDGTPRTITFIVTAQPDIPSGADNTLTTAEDTAYTFSANGAEFGF